MSVVLFRKKYTRIIFLFSIRFCVLAGENSISLSFFSIFWYLPTLLCYRLLRVIIINLLEKNRDIQQIYLIIYFSSIFVCLFCLVVCIPHIGYEYMHAFIWEHKTHYRLIFKFNHGKFMWIYKSIIHNPNDYYCILLYLFQQWSQI